MEPIVCKNIIEEKMVKVIFDMNGDTNTIPPVEFGVEGDVDLTNLIIMLSELIKHKRLLNVEYDDTGALLDSSSKITLIKETLDEIYSEFNKQFSIPENEPIQAITDSGDDLPF